MLRVRWVYRFVTRRDASTPSSPNPSPLGFPMLSLAVRLWTNSMSLAPIGFTDEKRKQREYCRFSRRSSQPHRGCERVRGDNETKGGDRV